MCDKDTEREIQQWLATSQHQDRRQFNKWLVAGTLCAGLTPMVFASHPPREQHVNVETPDGIVDALLVSPYSGKGAAVVVWPDIMGRRQAFDDMGRRLAGAGYTALVVNPFYRDIKGAALPNGISFPSDEAWQILQPMRKKLTAEAVVRDATAFLHFLDQQESVDTAKKAAIMGFCMSGAYTMLAAAALPDRIGAIASFHGGGLATDTPDSPHLRVSQSRAQALHAIAENDHARAPNMKGWLEQAYKDAGIHAEIEVYEGTLHGWTPTDSRVYHPQQAERAWQRMMLLFNQAL